MTTKYGFRDNVHNITVGPMAKDGTFREQVACGQRRITPITAETFDKTYPQWSLDGQRTELILANTAELAERVRPGFANPGQVQ